MSSLQALVAVLLRFWAATGFASVLYLTSIYLPLGFSSSPSSTVIQFGVVVPYVTIGAIGVALCSATWIYASRIAGYLIGPGEAMPRVGEVTNTDLVAIGTSLIAFYFLLAQLPDAIVHTAGYLLSAGEEHERLRSMFSIQRIVQEWATSLAALVILLQPRAMGRLFNWAHMARPGSDRTE